MKTKKEINKLLKLSKDERKLIREQEKERFHQEAIKQFPDSKRLTKTKAIKYKEALDTYPDLKELNNTKLVLIAYDFRQEQASSYHTEHTTELANARCNVQLGCYKQNNIPEDLPALSFEKDCVVCHLNKKGINLCPECWQLIRKCLDLRGRGHREGWEGWGVEMNLDLSNLVKLLRLDKEGSELLDQQSTHTL